MHQPPGTEKTKRFRPKLRYELIGCGLNGHELLGTDARKLRPKDHLFARESDGLRWYRCLRCDSWLPLPLPSASAAEFPPEQADIEPPLRGKLLRDRYVLRLIALDRAFHVILLLTLATVMFLFANHQTVLKVDYDKLLQAFQGVNGGAGGELSKLQDLFKLSPRRIYELGGLVLAYAALEATEMIGLWFAKRWAEYLTFMATILFIPYEIHELLSKPSALKIAAFVINLAIAVYLLYAKHLFGLNGGGKAEQAERLRDTGWPAIERATPKA